MPFNRKIYVVLTGCLLTALAFSCGSPDPKTDEAFNKVKEERSVSADSLITSRDSLFAVKRAALEVKPEVRDEWTIFRQETEKKIRSNEAVIKDIKGQPGTNNSLLRKVKSLEEDNNALRRKLDEYQLAMKEKWESFKTTMNHDANKIGIELKAMKRSTKK